MLGANMCPCTCHNFTNVNCLACADYHFSSNIAPVKPKSDIEILAERIDEVKKHHELLSQAVALLQNKSAEVPYVFQQKTESLDESLKLLWESHEKLLGNFEGFSESIEKRIDEIEINIISDEIQGIHILAEKIKKLECAFLDYQMEVTELKRFQNITHQQYQQVIRKKQPHKCPLCEGKGYWHRSEPNIACGGRCDACEGNGIIWG